MHLGPLSVLLDLVRVASGERCSRSVEFGSKLLICNSHGRRKPFAQLEDIGLQHEIVVPEFLGVGVCCRGAQLGVRCTLQRPCGVFLCGFRPCVCLRDPDAKAPGVPSR